MYNMVDTNFQIPTSFDPFAESNDSGSPGTKGSRALSATKYRGSHSDLLGFDDVQIPMTFDPSKDVGASGTKEYVHVRIQQRNNRKSLTTIQGLKKEFSYEKLLKDLNGNGNVVQDKELGKVIQLQGDQRKNVSQFLVNADIVNKEQIKIHGF